MDDIKKVWVATVTVDGENNYLVCANFRQLADALETALADSYLAGELAKTTINDYVADFAPGNIHIEFVEMTETELSELPEFEGF